MRVHKNDVRAEQQNHLLSGKLSKNLVKELAKVHHEPYQSSISCLLGRSDYGLFTLLRPIGFDSTEVSPPCTTCSRHGTISSANSNGPRQSFSAFPWILFYFSTIDQSTDLKDIE